MTSSRNTGVDVATQAQLETALRNADAAGATEDARALAAELSKMRAEKPAAVKPTTTPAGPNVAQQETDSNNFGQNLLLGVGKNINDTLLGGKQLINSVSGNRLFDKEKLAAEVAGNKPANDALTNTAGGVTGDIAASMIGSALPLGWAAKGATMLPKGAQAAAKLLPYVGVGAGQGMLTPDEKYDPMTQGATGAALGAAGDVIGRVVGRVLKPMQGLIPDAVKQQVALLPERANLLAENLTDNPYVKSMTNALAQIPGFGSGITKNRANNLEAGTRLITGAAGHEVPAITPTTAAALHDRVAQQTAAMGEGFVPVSGMRSALTKAKDENSLESMLLGTAKPENQIDSAIQGLREAAPATNSSAVGATLPQGMPAPPVALTPGVAPYTPIIPARSALTARTELGDQVFRNEHGISTSGADAIKEELDKGLRARFGNDFDKALAEHGTSLDVRALQAKPNAITPEGHIRPEEAVKLLPQTEIANPTTPYAKQLGAMADRMATPSLSENRSLAVRMLSGAPMLAGAGAVGALAGAGSGDVGTGVGVGAGSLGLARLLLGTGAGGRYLTGQNRTAFGKTLQSEKVKELAKLLGATSLHEMFNQ